MLYAYLGVAVLMGVTLMVLLVGGNMFVLKLVKRYQTANMEFKDYRQAHPSCLASCCFALDEPAARASQTSHTLCLSILTHSVSCQSSFSHQPRALNHCHSLHDIHCTVGWAGWLTAGLYGWLLGWLMVRRLQDEAAGRNDSRHQVLSSCVLPAPHSAHPFSAHCT